MIYSIEHTSILQHLAFDPETMVFSRVSTAPKMFEWLFFSEAKSS